jgi:Heparinase II/III-like protein/Heparinase II/III N-terminus
VIPARAKSARLIWRTAWWAVPAGVVLLVWVPEINHYRVSGVRITDEMLRSARQSPPDSVLRELDEFRLLDVRWADKEQVVRAAERLLGGVVEVPGYPPESIGMPFDARDLDSPRWQLLLPGLTVPRILLDAYNATGRNEFLAQAQAAILALGKYERRTWLPRGLLWNDHAVAARMNVLAEFWRAYRGHPSYRSEIGKAILEQAARNGRLLAKPEHFMVATSHGIMQNLALLHLSLAFPTLPEAARYKRLALHRLRDQMPFYMDDDGVVLEHSGGYQEWGLYSLGLMCRYLTLLREPIPEGWIQNYQRGQRFLSVLRRPDGSLPMFGDTPDSREELGRSTIGPNARGGCTPAAESRSQLPESSFSLYPVAGYAIWWGGLRGWPNQKSLSQTVTVWSNFPGHAHKHADEMSVLLWAGGQTWWTNVGYWPYWHAGRLEAESWAGASAPHLANEPTESVRSTRLLSYGRSDRLTAIDLERRGPGQYAARRQVVHVSPRLWLVVDHVFGDDTSKTRTIWTAPPDVRLRQGTTPGSYVSEAPRTSSSLKTFVVGSSGASVKELRGSLVPFAGWHVTNGIPTPAPAIMIEQPARDSWTVVTWLLDHDSVGAGASPGNPRVSYWNGPRDWRIEIPLPSERLAVRRADDQIVVSDLRTQRAVETLPLVPAPDVTRHVARIRDAFAAAAKQYPAYRNLHDRRVKVSWLLLIIFVSQEAFFLAVRRWRASYYGPLRLLNVLGWGGVGLWLVLFFVAG